MKDYDPGEHRTRLDDVGDWLLIILGSALVAVLVGLVVYGLFLSK